MSSASVPLEVPPSSSDSTESKTYPAFYQGIYRQNGSTLVILESDHNLFNDIPDQPVDTDHLERLIFIKEQNVLQWRILRNDEHANNNFTDFNPHFFCLRCKKRFLNGTDLQIHASSFHPETASIIPKSLQCAITTFLMNDLSACKGESIRDPSNRFLPTMTSALESDIVPSIDLEQLVQRNAFITPEFSLNPIFQQMPFSFINGTHNIVNSLDSDLSGSSTAVIASNSLTARNSSKTLKCPKCNWHYKYQETLEIHMKEKHCESEVKCIYCLQSRPHPRLARGENYSCGYKPYRCEICKYSTTTKGNLSIHMQSDKHLHAIQEMPSIVSGTSTGVTNHDADFESTLQCLICSVYSTDNPLEMVDHIEKDRSRPAVGDISIIHGVYQCNLCPYSTNLKANFQLHTRTDKHIQRVQMMNHIREGGGAGSSNAICRLSAVKSTVQVRCRACQEVLSCPSALTDHCDSRSHETKIAQLGFASGQNPGGGSSPPNPDTLFECRSCQFETINRGQALEHMQCHASNDDKEPVLTVDGETKEVLEENINNNEEDVEMSDAVFYCTKCDFISKTKDKLEEHSRTAHLTERYCGNEQEEQCPLCPSRSQQLRNHLAEVHRIAEEAIERLLITASSSGTMPATTSSTSIPDSSTDNAAKIIERQTYRFRCKQCALAFRTEKRLACHVLNHSFRTSARCPQCSRVFRSMELLRKHIAAEHIGKSNVSGASTSSDHYDSEINEEEGRESDERYNDPLRPFRCELCKENFDQKHQLMVHYNSVNHLHQAKAILEQQAGNFRPSNQILAALQASTSFPLTAPQTSSSTQPKPFKCNICKHGYGQGSTLDIHVRSVAHQSRLSKIGELVAQGELDPSKPILEQPGGPAQKTIGEVASKGDLDQSTSDQQSTLTMMNIFNMAQFLSMATANQNSGNDLAANQQANMLANIAANAFPANTLSPFGILGQFSSAYDAYKAQSSDSQQSTEDDRTPRSGIAFRKMLETYGFDIVMQYNECAEQRKRKLDNVPDEVVPELCRAECSICNSSFSSIWVLKAHYEEMHDGAMPADEVEKFAVKLRTALDEIDEKENLAHSEVKKKRSLQESIGEDRDESTLNADENSSPEAKRSRDEVRSISASSTPRPSTSKDNLDLNSQLAMMGILGFPFMANPFMPVVGPDFFTNSFFGAQSSTVPLPHGISGTSGASPTKRARTRITDDQLKVLRQYFDINNSPSEQQIKEMSIKTQLPEKVIKHWFRNTLFKERQRDKDSPYNFSVPPQMSIDLDTYERTGEAKVTSIRSDYINDDENKNSTKSSPNESTSSSNNIAASLTSSNTQVPLQNSPILSNPFAAFLQDDKAISSMLPSISTSNTASGRRANRTRFTDYQLRTLQQFFDKQAYPKDDDLEILSKKLQLSPRVIVVWFQNARQKARKIYENQPSTTHDDRFMKTPGSNFQCKRCQLVFQRYYELIQHQQKMCYKDDCIAQQKDNKGVEENLSEDEKSLFDSDCRDVQRIASGQGGSQTNLGALAQLIGAASSDTGTDISQADFFKLLASAKPSQDATLKLKVREKKKVFYKRCPFCCLLFHSRESLIGHIPSRHPEQATSTPVDVDLLPDAEDVPTITTISSDDTEVVKINGNVKKSEFAPLDLSCAANGDGREDSVSMSPSYYQSDNDDNSDNVETCDQYNGSSPIGVSNTTLGNIQRSPANSKRYRTHLTPLQVHIMKSVFAEYKTPSMTECDTLGTEIGLHKRVVQVWFQNARAKERKTRSYNGEDEMLRCTASRCTLCAVEYSHRLTLHDHIFTSEHLTKVKRLLHNESTSDRETVISSENMIDKDDNQRIRIKAVRDRKVVKSTSGILPNNTGPLAVSQFPYNLVYGLQPGLAPILYDPNLMGTPIPLLQIPESIMTQISADMSAGQESTKFTQDGKTFQQLIAVLPFRDFQCAASKDSEVGWACPQCTNVFQQEILLKNHQRLICQNCDSVFKLIQSHYECRACNTKLGTQVEFKLHCESSDHQKAREIFLGNSSSS